MALTIDGIQSASSAAELDQKVLNLTLTLGTAATAYLAVPWSGRLVTAYSVINGALTGADETLTLKNSAGSAMTGGTITVTQSGSAAGDIDSASPTANQTFSAGQKLQIDVGGENGSAVTAYLSLLFQVT